MNTKPHYDILDGLRGVAALMVLVYHLFEAIAFADGKAEQCLYHGFMGVDFFFILSGFVMGYAYDDRWDRMSVGQFIRRRLIRLHPMVVVGVLLGSAAFIIQGCVRWDGTAVNTLQIIVTTMLALLMLPALSPQFDIRGNTEMFPLNGPHWSMFFEYIGSLLYALLLRRLSTKALRLWVAFFAMALTANAFTIGNGTIAYGWSYEPTNIMGGALRLLFAYPAGLLLAREYKARKVAATHKPVFLLSSLTLILTLAVPSMSRLYDSFNANALYQSVCVTLVFPAIIVFAARGSVSGTLQKCVSYLGRLSYPLYAVHYPMIYLYIHWINNDIHPFGTAVYATPLGIAAINILIAILCLHLYDEPLRKWLSNRFLREQQQKPHL